MKKKHQVLVVGDCMVDEYIIGKHERNSPEADVAILEELRRESRPGGAANVALNLKKLGIDCLLVGVIGDDESGHQLKSMLEEENILYEFVVDASRPTTTKKRYVDTDYNQLLRVDRELAHELDSKCKEYLLELLSNVFDDYRLDAIILQDYDKGLLDKDSIDYITKWAQKENTLILSDPKFQHFEQLAESHIFKPNINECLNYIPRQKGQDLSSYLLVVSNALSQTQNLLITLGKDGIYYKNNKEEGFIQGWPVDNADVSGAGDCVIAVACIFALQGKKLEVIADLCNKAGALSCAKKGIQTISMDEILNFEA